MHPILFFTQLLAEIKLYHWMTNCYAKHMATDILYEKLQDHIDRFIEVYIGRYGRPQLNKQTITLLKNKDILTYGLTYLTKTLPTYIKEDDTDLQNIKDEMIAEFNQAKYRFTLK